VVIKVNGTHEQVYRFGEGVKDYAPDASSIEFMEVKKEPYEIFTSFEIRRSEDVSDSVTEISPDIAVCQVCLEDMKKQPHRMGYPLINCTHCGPRFSIIRELPYDRPHTTMAPFEMCPACHSEYTDVEDRRFHAQPVACNQCGPVYSLRTADEFSEEMTQILGRIRSLISGGALLAVKGTGGFHLMCDAFHKQGISKLRQLKRRDGKPFALMFSTLEKARRYVEISAREEELLTSWRRPIVLLRKRREITHGIADGLSTLGVMLPYMPFHYLLFEHLETFALVMTSGNFSEEPILISNREALEQFSGQVDGIVTYNREIFNRVDDSVVTVIRNTPVVLRRARGYAPSPLRTGLDLEGVLGTGAELTGSFCMGKGKQALMSQYCGDLKNLETYGFYKEIFERFSGMFRFTPSLVVSDLHPDYLSSRFAQQLVREHPGTEHMKVQHHHAHIASGMINAGLEGEVIGFGFDGTGLGEDGHIWGAEVMRAGYDEFERLFHFEYIPLPGGDKTSKEPWRMGIAYLYRSYGEELFELKIPVVESFSRREISTITQMIDQEIHTPLASSAGRLFDAVAALTGLNYYSTYQAQAPMLLESALDPAETGIYPYLIQGKQIRFTPLIRSVVDDLHQGASLGQISARFHLTLVDLMIRLAIVSRKDTGLDRVVLGGGTFQNRFLSEKVMDSLEKEKFEVYLPDRIPVNDQGIAAGQVAIGAYRRKISK
jgi:hydrogenase maturation protein HypF